MKAKTYKRIITVTLVMLCTIFAVQLISDNMTYQKAIECISNGDYGTAEYKLTSLGEDFRDASALAQYCAAMQQYDPTDFKSVFVCRNKIDDIRSELVNKNLLLEITKTTTEIDTLYNSYSN